MTAKTLKRLVAAAVLCALAGGGAWFLVGPRGDPERATQKTAAVTRGDIKEVVTSQGKLEPKDYVDVGVQISGQLKKLYVEIGSAVKKGDLIAELDPAPYQSRYDADAAKLKSLQAQLLEEKANFDLNETLLKRAQGLFAAKAVSQEELDTKEATLKKSAATLQSLEAQIEEAQANLASDGINLGYTKIFAPMDGIVSDQIAREGQTLNANQTTPKIVQVANLDIMTVRVQVAEADIMRLKPEMETAFSTLGAMDKRWKGRIRQILPTPEVVSDVVLYNVLIDVENTDHALMNGMSTQVYFETAQAAGALLVPTQALGKKISEKPDGATYLITIRKNGQTEEREVLVGLITRAQTEVRSGLAEGETVLLQNAVAGASDTKKKTTSPPSMGARL